MKNSFIKSILEQYEVMIHNTNKKDASFFSTWFLEQKKELYLEEKKKQQSRDFNKKIPSKLKK